MIAQHGSMNLSIGAVGLKGLVYVDDKVELKMQPCTNGMEKSLITPTVQNIMMGSKFNGVRLCEVVMTTHSGSWGAY